MGVRINFMVQTSTSPNWWREYAIATLQRIVYFGFDGMLTTWMNWAGFTSYQKFPPPNNGISNYVMFKDSNNALICFDGTNGWEQWWGNVSGAGYRTDLVSNLHYHSYFLWRAQQAWPDVTQFLSQMNPAPNVMVCGHSLGGAVAHIIADRLYHLHQVASISRETLGQPRVACGLGSDIFPVPTIRLVWQPDPVPGVPTALSLDTRTIFIPGVNTIPTRFFHTEQAWIMMGNGTYQVADSTLDNELPGLVITAAEAIRTWSDEFGRRHYPSVYVRELAKFPAAQVGSPDMASLVLINQQLDSWDRLIPVPGLPDPIPEHAPIGTPANPFVDPNAVFNGSGAWPTLPDGDVGRRVEQRGVSHALFFFGGRDIVAKQFQGHDRQMLVTLKKVITNIQARDARVGNPKPTRKLSNRILMYPSSGGTPTHLAELNDVLTQCNTLLALTK